MPLAGVQQGHVQCRRRIVRQHRHQLAAGQLIVNAQGGHLGQAKAADARRPVSVGAVDRDAPGHGNPLHLVALYVFKPWGT
eukprot:gene17396-20754_t